MESLLSAVADGMSRGRHNSNVELVTQEVVNLASPLFGRHSGNGSDRAHSDEHPLAGAHAVTLLTILVAAAPLARYVPLATLSAVLFVVAYNLIVVPIIWTMTH